FTVVTREVKSFNDTDGSNRSIRGSLDMEMAMDVISLSDTLDGVVLCTGDGDFRPVVDALARRGKHVEVCALREMTSTDLIAATDVYVDLASLKDRIALDAPPPNNASREIRNDIDTSADGYEDFKVQDTTFDF
ncbi:NYN domain-containing protein, partial [bacterium]|nr:NYN domain-containing protein [bacterium]